MNRLINTTVATLVASAIVAATPGYAASIRIAGNFALEHSSSKAMEVFAESLSEKTSGELTAQIFPAMQLGGAKENVDQVRSGVLMGTWIGAAYLSRTVPELEAISLPFGFGNREDAFAVIDGGVGELLEASLAEKGFIALGWMELGSRNITNSQRPLETVADFEGLKIRLQPNETHLSTFRQIGANPVSMGIKEVYSALQQGVLDGQENPFSIIATRKFNEVQTYLSDSAHFFDFILVVVNKRKFEKLPEAQQTAVHEAMAEAVAWQRAKAAEEDVASLQALIDSGMIFTPLSDELRAELQQLSAPVIDSLRDRIGTDIVDAVLEQSSQLK